MTGQAILSTRSIMPTGSIRPNRSSRTVSPMMQTARPARTSPSLKLRPAASDQSWVTR